MYPARDQGWGTTVCHRFLQRDCLYPPAVNVYHRQDVAKSLGQMSTMSTWRVENRLSGMSDLLISGLMIRVDFTDWQGMQLLTYSITSFFIVG